MNAGAGTSSMIQTTLRASTNRPSAELARPAGIHNGRNVSFPFLLRGAAGRKSGGILKEEGGLLYQTHYLL